jgi:hypothetical protein
MNETQIAAQINMLVQQRDNALNTCVNLAGDLAALEAVNKDLQAQIELLKGIVEGAKEKPDETT